MKKTPRPYLSYSQLSALEYSEAQYIKNYIWGKKQEDNEYFRVGKLIHSALEKREEKHDQYIEDIKKQIKKYPQREHKIEVMLGDIPLYGVLDGFSRTHLKICDYKTGMKPNLTGWKNQALFYSLMIFLKYKKIPKEFKIFYIKTKRNDEDQLVVVGSVREYNIDISLKDIIRFTPRVIKGWARIHELVINERNQWGELPCDKKVGSTL
jgi:hypothetical protein